MTIDRGARRNKVLEAIVNAHISSAMPVGSNKIARGLDLSSATIRNVMFELERDGYIKQPHTSAGRIPTDLGYRKYVDNLMPFGEARQDKATAKVRQYLNEKRFFEDVIEETSRALSRMTKYTGIALSPGHKLYFDGTYHMLEQPEFREMEMARDFLMAIEEKEELLQILNEDLETMGVKIRIGRENIFENLRECTIITATYRFKNRVSGNLGVIGPIRMRYEEIVPMVNLFADMTTEILEEIA